MRRATTECGVAEGAASSTGAAAARLDDLEGQRLDRFDPVACEFVADLLARAEGLGGRARALLEARARTHLARLEAAHRAAEERARRAIDALGSAGVEPHRSGSLDEALLAGDPVTALRGARRLRASGAVATRRGRRGAHRRYRDALADLQTELAKRPATSGDADAGLLNGNVLAARILVEADAISPAWRRSLVASLLDLGSLLHLPEPPPPRRRR